MKLQTAKNFDRENFQRPSSFDLKCEAIYESKKRIKTSNKVHVRVLDVNDNHFPFQKGAIVINSDRTSYKKVSTSSQE